MSISRAVKIALLFFNTAFKKLSIFKIIFVFAKHLAVIAEKQDRRFSAISTDPVSFVKRDQLVKADAIVALTGNGWERTEFAIRLYRENWAPILLTVGATGSRPAPLMAELAEKRGVPKENIIVEPNSHNTRQNAENTLRLANDHGWQKIILVTSPQHQLRAYLTFKAAKKTAGSHCEIINYPPTDYSWFDHIESSRNPNKTYFRFWYIFSELYRIIKYRLKGDL